MKPDVILIATLNPYDALAVNFFPDGTAGNPEPGLVAELPSVINHFKRSGGYEHYRNLGAVVESVFLVRRGFDVSKAREMVNDYLKKFYPRIH